MKREKRCTSRKMGGEDLRLGSSMVKGVGVPEVLECRKAKGVRRKRDPLRVLKFSGALEVSGIQENSEQSNFERARLGKQVKKKD